MIVQGILIILNSAYSDLENVSNLGYKVMSYKEIYSLGQRF
jgi:hypothetical protein